MGFAIDSEAGTRAEAEGSVPSPIEPENAPHPHHHEHRVEPTRIRPTPWIILSSALALGLVGGVLGGFLGAQTGGRSTPVTMAPPAAVSPSVCDAARVAGAVLPAIVTISVSSGETGGVGSGSIIRNDGYILTNDHVISPGATSGRIVVIFSNGHQVEARLVGRDPKADIAVLKVDAGAKLPTVAIGDSDRLVVGQPVVALGAPLGLSSTVTTGIVSALGRNVPVPTENEPGALLAGAVQTDAAINPGNSGGALVDCAGAQVGVNTAIATVPTASGEAGGGSVGIGFAVPMNLAGEIVDQLIETGTVSYPYIGVAVVVISADVAEKFGTEQGLFIESVVAGSPAETAGLQAGDVIASLDGVPAASMTVLTHLQLTRSVGDLVAVTYVRDGATATTNVTLGLAP